MKLTNTHRLILEMLLHHPEGIRREEINEVLNREGERVLDDRRRLYKYLDSFRKSLGLNIATVSPSLLSCDGAHFCEFFLAET